MNGDVDRRSYKSNAISGNKKKKKRRDKKITASDRISSVAPQKPRLAINNNIELESKEFLAKTEPRTIGTGIQSRRGRQEIRVRKLLNLSDLDSEKLYRSRRNKWRRGCGFGLFPVPPASAAAGPK